MSSVDPFNTARKVTRKEGRLIGISSGAAVYTACETGTRPGKRPGKRPGVSERNIVVILPSSGEQYLSTSMFEVEHEKTESSIAI